MLKMMAWVLHIGKLITQDDGMGEEFWGEYHSPRHGFRYGHCWVLMKHSTDEMLKSKDDVR